MRPNWKKIYAEVYIQVQISWASVKYWLYFHRWQIFLLGTLFLLISCKDIQLSIDLNSSPLQGIGYSTRTVNWEPETKGGAKVDWSALLNSSEGRKESKASKPLANPSPTVPKRKPVAKLDRSRLNAKQRSQMAYVDRFAQVARLEMEKYGIPASITLAQGLLESSSGKSVLASKHNNHFGIKCFHRNCSPGHCFNYADDSPKDFFRSYHTAWESFRAHSEFLMRDRYATCRSFGRKDYKKWAHGLAEAGYATDPKYGEKLISLIESLGLHEYDQ